MCDDCGEDFGEVWVECLCGMLVCESCCDVRHLECESGELG